MHQPRTQTLMLSSSADADVVTDTNPYFFSAPASPTHFLLSSSPAKPAYSSFYSAGTDDDPDQPNFEFSLAARSMSTAEELFFNGQIRPGFLPADEAPSHRRTRSMSPTRTPRTVWREKKKELASHNLNHKPTATATSNSNNASALTSRSSSSNSSSSLSSSSSNASSRRWGFIKSLLPLQRSKSEGLTAGAGAGARPVQRQRNSSSSSHNMNCANGCEGIGHRRQRQRLSADKAETVVPRAKEAVRRRTTFLPYKQQGFLFGCMGFGSRAFVRNISN